MTKQELDAKIAAIDKEAQRQKNIAIKEYCDANNPYQIGAVFTDHMGSIRIESISYDRGSFGSSPCCVYTGIELKANGEPKKGNPKRSAFQSNEKK